MYSEEDLCRLAKQYREASGKKRAQAAREMGVSQTSIFNAEETPSQSLTRLRIQMIEAYADLQVSGPLFVVKQKQPATTQPARKATKSKP